MTDPRGRTASEPREHRHRTAIKPWSWPRVHSCWRERAAAFGVPPEPLFLPIRLHDPKHPVGRESEIVWWKAETIRARAKRAQLHLRIHPGTSGPILNYMTPRGHGMTLAQLWKLHHDPEAVAALLITATLRLVRHFSEAMNVIVEAAQGYLARIDALPSWHGNVRRFLPMERWRFDYAKLPTVRRVLHALADDHARLFRTYQPVLVEFHASPDPDLDAEIAAEITAERWARAERRAHEEREEAARFAARRAAHPLFERWSSLSAEELEQLVWSQPICDVARLFGVSDSAVCKRCKALRIPTPGRGFWTQVQTGRRPRPQGLAPGQGDDAARRAAHPLSDQWRTVSVEELMRLIWSMPARNVAKLFGVSAAAISKRCTALGIPRPELGFWLQVRAGRRPHPQGQVPDEVRLGGR